MMVPHCRDVVLMAAGYKRGAQIDSGLCRQTQNNRKYKNWKRLLERVTQPVHPNAIDPLCSGRKIKHATYKTNLADFNQLINIWLEYECEECMCVCVNMIFIFSTTPPSSSQLLWIVLEGSPIHCDCNIYICLYVNVSCSLSALFLWLVAPLFLTPWVAWAVDTLSSGCVLIVMIAAKIGNVHFIEDYECKKTGVLPFNCPLTLWHILYSYSAVLPCNIHTVQRVGLLYLYLISSEPKYPIFFAFFIFTLSTLYLCHYITWFNNIMILILRNGWDHFLLKVCRWNGM